MNSAKQSVMFLVIMSHLKRLTTKCRLGV
jgi:hypothetical protein